MTATNSQTAAEYERAGANLVFRFFKDATEQAADALTYAMDFLLESVDWPVSFLELRIRSDASAAGQTIKELPLSALGISVLAVSRGGRIFYEPTPEFRIFPSDRLLLMGHPDGLKDAENILNQLEVQRNAHGGRLSMKRFKNILYVNEPQGNHNRGDCTKPAVVLRGSSGHENLTQNSFRN